MEKGVAAEAEGRRKEAFDFFDQAITRYADVRRDHPDTRPEYIEERMAECRARMLKQFADAEAVANPTETFDPIPIGETAVADLPQNEVTTIRRRRAPAEPVPSVPIAPTVPIVPAISPSAALSADVADTDVEPTSIDARVPWLIARGRAADAVLLMDAVVGDNTAEAPLLPRLLLARALLAAGNTIRAIDLLDAMMRQFPDDPAVLTLAAGANLAHGNAYTALKALDDLVREHPRYADAYIDFAYTRFAMDPVANRDEAVIYYRNALALGAARDPRLEKELDITVAP